MFFPECPTYHLPVVQRKKTAQLGVSTSVVIERMNPE